MNAIRIRTRVDAETVRHLPELEPMLGKEVEMIILDETSEPAAEPLETMETFLGDALHRPPPTREELEELRVIAKTDPAIAAILEIYESGGPNVEAIVELRTNSPIWSSQTRP